MNLPRRHSRLAWLPFIIWMATIFGLSSIPRPELPPVDIPNIDKAIHAAAFAVGGFLTARAAASIASAVLIPAAYGLVDEWHQRGVPGRDPNLADWFADCIGVLVGVVIGRRRQS